MNAIPSISFFERLYKPVSKPCTLEEIIILIRRRHWAYVIIAYRAALEQGHPEEARKLKNNLPGFTPSGVFRGGHKASQLECYNQVVGLDFDDVADLPRLQAFFRSQPHTLGMFVSPGGNGLKVFVPVDSGQERHAEAFAAVAAHYERLAGMTCDRKCKDISRCCYVSCDEEAFYNPEALPFTVVALSPAELFAGTWLDRHPATEGNRNETVYRLGCEANRQGFAQEEMARICVSRLQASDFTSEEIFQALQSAYQGHTKEYASSGKELRTETALTAPYTIEGEDLRRATPFLPDWLPVCLPGLLNEAIRYYIDPRERDMALLAACTVLSACLPGVWGIYNRKRVYPHLFTIEVAPPANGKGCVTDMCHLADLYANLLEIESKRREQEYLQELEEWELKKTAAHHKGQAVQVSEMPQKASVCYFFIPTQITKAKLLVHLSDNGDLGGLMADSEIDTLTSASKQDYGMFDDVLRKSFHNEWLASSRKTDNEMIRVPHPRLAVLLAGTPGQFARLIPNVENGLASRLLLYTCRSKAVWQDVSSGNDLVNYESYLSGLSERVLEAATLLRKRPLRVKLTQPQWIELNKRFGRLLQDADLFGSEHFLSVVKRHGLIAFRLCMLFTALDVAQLDYGVDERCCSDTHFRAALAITETCLEHSRLLMTQLSESAGIPELTCPFLFRDIFEGLPDRFTLQDIYPICQAAGIGERAVRRYLARLEPTHVVRIARGFYVKKDTSSSGIPEDGQYPAAS